MDDREKAAEKVAQFMKQYPEIWEAICGLETEPEYYPNVAALLRDAKLYELEAMLAYRYDEKKPPR